ncbi:uncharacterized protein LOC134450527 [Engraulis encrasicolus]|uniref:uncharacterized protein LOC134450527 n=1 Tax=Engraulis encrasicolus TaxID=184585 RepID=UPI002FD68C02
MAEKLTESETPVAIMEEEAVTQMRKARQGKVSHITRRINIVKDLMKNNDFIDEVKENMTKFNEFFEEFKTLHASYADMLDETTRVEDEENWYKPKLADIAAFIDKVFEWIKSVENSSSPSATEVTTSANVVQVHQSDPLILDGAQAELDLFDVQSHRSNASSRRSHTSTRSLRINAEAEREALLTEASKLQQKHAIEEQELLLRKQREALELSVKLDASNAKINYLKAAEKNSLGPIPFDLDATHMSALGGGASQVEQLNEELESPISFLDTPSVKPKVNAAHVNVPLLNPDHNMATLPNRPTSSEQVQCTALPSLPYGGDINISSLQIQPAVSSAQDALPTQPPSQPPTSLSIESQAMPLQPLWLKPRPLLQPQLQAPLLSQSLQPQPLQPQLPAPLQPQAQPPPHTQAPLQLQQQSQPPPSPLPQPPLQPQQPVPQFQPPPLQPQRRPQQQSQRQLHPQLQPSQPPWPQLQPPLLPQQLQSQLRTQQPQPQLQFRPPQALQPQPPPQIQAQLQAPQLRPQPTSWPQLQHLSQLPPQPQPTPLPQLQLQPPLALQPQSQAQAQTPSSSSSQHDGHMIKVLENQNELTRLLMKQQLSSTLPQGNIPVFDVKQLLQEPTTSSSPQADASVSGYGCVSNIRQVNKQNVVHAISELEMSRIHPPQNIAVPGLELAATALLEKEDWMLRRGLPLDMESSVFWKKEEPIISKHHPCEVEPEGRRWSEPGLADSASQEKDKADAESRCSTMIQATKRKDEDHIRCKKPGPG